MKEADLFRQYAKEAMRWSSKSANADEKWALLNLAGSYAQAALMSKGYVGVKLCSSAPLPGAKGDLSCLLIFLWTIPARNAASH